MFYIVNLVIITLISYNCVDLFYESLFSHLKPYALNMKVVNQPESEHHTAQTKNITEHPLSFYRPIIDRNLFDTLPQKQESATDQTATMQHTDMNLRLWGTIAGTANQCYAVIEETKSSKSRGQQNLYHVGDRIQNALITQILRDKVVLDVQGEKQLLKIEEFKNRSSRFSRARARLNRNRINANGPLRELKLRKTIRKSQIERATQNLPQLMKQVQIRPNAEGLKLYRVRGGLFRRLGLRSGDIITEIDGQSIQSVDNALAFYQELKNASHLNIRVKRGRRYRSIDYSIR